MANIPLAGTYCKTGAYIVSHEARFVVGKRQTPALNKPLYYLTYKPLSGGDKPLYISSLFPVENGTYTIEYKGIKYHYVDSGDQVTITKVTP
jgi:hypothetical protein